MSRAMGFVYAASVLLVASAPVLTACSDGNEGTGGSGATSSSSSAGGSGGAGGGSGGAGGGMGGNMLIEPTPVAAFDVMKGELPEGLVVDAAGENAYVGIAVTGQIKKITLADGMVSDFGSVPPPPPMNKGLVLGLAFADNGDILVATASFDASYKAAIWRIPAAGGAGVEFATDPTMVFPNGIAVDKDGSLYVSEATGKIFHISKDGATTETWFADPMYLKADPASKCPSGYSIGANGIGLSGGAVWITNTDNASLVKIVKNPDGTAGAATAVVPTNCSTFAGVDGLTVAPDGFYVAANQQNAVLHVTNEGVVTKIATKNLDFPASVHYSDTPAGKAVYVTNAAFITAMLGSGKPGVVKITLP